jgi:serine/threonine-protein kinase RsbW
MTESTATQATVAHGAAPVHLVLAGQPQLLRVARLVGAGLAAELDVDVETLADIRLAIGEAGALCLQLGAAGLTFDYRLDSRSLIVELVADVAASAEDEADLQLTRQILAVACSSFESVGDGTRLSIRMTFDAPS